MNPTRMEGGHQGHERLHDTLVLVSLGILVSSQIALYFWRNNYPKSYRQVTLLGMWSLPIAMSVWFKFWRMIATWVAFTCCNIVIMKMIRIRPMPKETPRKVYIFFFLVYKLTYAITVLGYLLMVAEFLGLTQALAAALGKSETALRVGHFAIMCLFYGLYYGVLNRDLAEVVTDKMAVKMGFSRKGDSIPVRQYDPNACLLCGQEINTDKTVTLPSCKHTFHEFCIRGWTLVGKKDTCPYCAEKVALNLSFKNHWENHSLLFGQLLDAVRYLVVWNPLILLFIDLMFYFVDVPNPVTAGIHAASGA